MSSRARRSSCDRRGARTSPISAVQRGDGRLMPFAGSPASLDRAGLGADVLQRLGHAERGGPAVEVGLVEAAMLYFEDAQRIDELLLVPTERQGPAQLHENRILG